MYGGRWLSLASLSPCAGQEGFTLRGTGRRDRAMEGVAVAGVERRHHDDDDVPCGWVRR